MNNTNHSKSIPQRARHHHCRWCLLPLLLLLALPAAVEAQFLYTTNNGTITITGYTGPGGDVTIPDTISGLPVTSIGDSAFAGCSGLTSVTMGPSVTSIEFLAFQLCTSLTSITIGTSVTSIGQGAFSGCHNLANVIIPASVTSIGVGAFSGCYLLSWIRVDTNNPAYSSVDGVLFNKSQTTLFQYPLASAATSYTIPNSVTSIGTWAFSSCYSLASVTIGPSVTSIGDFAFAGCSGLTSVSIGNSVTSIGQFAFQWCTSLTNLTIGTSVTNIGYHAFEYCTSLTYLIIPASVTSIGVGAFSDCSSLSWIRVDTNNPAYSSVDGVLFNKGETTLVQYPIANAATSYTIPNSVTNIGCYAFEGCSRLANMTIENNVTSIGDSAFARCPLTGVTIGPSVTNIGDYAFSFTSLTNLTIGNGVTCIGDSAFEECRSLTNVTIGSGVTNIGNSAFFDCSSLSSVWMGSSVTSIGYSAFVGCASLMGIYFNGNTPNLEGWPFSGVNNATVYYLPGTTGWGTTFGGLPTALWQQGAPEASTLSASSITTNSATLNGTVNPNGWPTTAWFEWGTTTSYGKLTSVADLGSGTIALPLSAPLAGLTPGITYHFRVAARNDHYGLVYGGDQSFTPSPLPLVSTLPATGVSTNSAILNGTVNPIGWPTTAWFQWGTTINYGSLASVADLGSGTAAVPLSAPLAGLTPGVTYHFRIAATNDNGLAYGGDQSFTTLGPPQVSTLPATAVSTGSAALHGTVNPNGWPTTAWFQWGTTINYGSLTSVDDLGSGTAAVPLSAPLAALTPGVTYHFRIAATNDCGLAYGSDQSFTTASLESQVAYTTNNGSITITGYTGPGGDVTIPGTINGLPVTSIGDSAFWGQALTSVTIPNSVTFIGDWAFGLCLSLTNVTIPNSVISIGHMAFVFCGRLTSVSLGSAVTSIGSEPFEDCTNLTSITVDALNPAYCSVEGVLFNKTQTTLVQYPLGLAAASYTIPNGVTSVEDGAFAFSQRLTNITLPSSVTSIGNRAFWECGSLTSFTIPDGDTSIGDSAFAGCTSLTNVTIPNRVTSIGNYAFDYCTSLTALHFGGNAPSLGGSSVFQDDNQATVYYLPGTTGWGTSFGGLPTALWQTPPEAWTLSVTSITADRATLNGVVNPNGWLTTAWFQWGATTSYGNLTPMSELGSGATALPLAAPLAGLTLGVTYHFRVAARNYYGLIYGSDQSFTTSPLPLVSTLPATGVSTNSATLNGTVNPIGWPTTAWFQWGSTANYGNLTSVADLGSGTNALPFSAPLAGLTPGVTYHFRVAATSDNGLAYGSDQSFTTARSPTEFNYTITNGTITITGYTGPGGDVTIPGTINGLPVTRIGDSAFWGRTLTSVTIPNRVTSIGDWAFGLCLSLSNVTIPDSVTSIGHMAFVFCGRLTSVSLGSAVTSIGSEPFEDCTNLTSITIDALNPAYCSVEGVLFNKTQTTLVQYPLGLAAASYTIPNGVTSVEDGAFAFSQRLTNITLPSSVTSIGNRAFYTCGSLRSITILDGVASIGDSAFAGCTSLTNLTIPNRVSSIGDYAFDYCTSLTSVTFSSGVTSIGDWAFMDCTRLTALHFGGNAPSLGGSSVFSGDTKATVYYLPGTTGWGTTFGGLPTALWQPGPPEASTLFASSSTTNSTTLNGTVNPDGYPTTAWFEWGTTTDYGNLTSVTNLGSGTNALPFSAPLAGLSPGVTYHFRIAATNDNGVAYGSDQSFTTLGLPQVSTLLATAFTATNAMLNGTVNPNGYPTTGWFQWGTTTSYGLLTPATGLGSGTTALPLSAPLTGLSPGVTYHFRVAATNAFGLFYGSDQSFTTGTMPPPEVYTLSATGATSTTATLNGTVNPDGWPTSAWFQWGTTTSYGNLTAATALGSGTTALPLSVPLAGLTPNVTYHFRVAAANDNGVVYGSDQSFTTPAQSGGAGWTLNGGATMTGNTITLTIGAGSTSRSAFLNNMQDVTAFHIVFFYQDVSGAGSADGVTFCIQNDPQGATALGGGSGGSSLGYEHITPSVALAMNIYAGNGRGVALFQNGAVTYGYASLLPDVDIGGNADLIQVNVDYNGTVMTVTFKDTVTGGIASTNWTVNIPSVVGGSTAYVGFTGADGGVASIQTITWGNSSPTILISTLPATSVSPNSAILNGTVNPNASPATAWFEWGLTTGYGNLTSVADLGSGTNALPLSAPLAGLTPGVTYHFRVAATNENGLVYGSDQSFATLGPPLVTTLPVTGVSASGATLNGTVNPNGWPTTAWFQWGTTTSYGNLTAVTNLGSGTTALPLSAPLAGLTPGVTYHFRVAATNDYGLAYGSDQSFTATTSPSEFNYTINNGLITITGYTGAGGAVTIPDWINGLPVTSIGYNAFTDCTRLTNLTIPNSLTSIGRQAFWHCTNLASISVDGLNSTYSSVNGVLFDKTQTTLVQYPAGIAATFYTIPDSVTSIGEGAFEFGVRLTDVSIPNGVTSIGDYAFWACNSLTNPMIPNSVTNIGDSAFSECTSLTSITIPNRVTRIGGGTFADCIRLTSITIPDSVTTIGTNAFFDCTGLTNVTIGSGVTDLRSFAFYECTNLTALHFEGNAPSLGGYVFQGDNRATVYYLPWTTGWGTTFGGLPTELWTQVPTLQASPQSQTAEAASAVGLRVQASSPLPLFYFWYLNATNLLSAGTNWQLELTNLQSSQAGTYTVVISNVLGAITGGPALLNVIAEVERRPVPGVKVTGEGGSLLNVDYADSLSPAPIWTPLGSVSLTSTSQFYFDLTLPLPAQRFYRGWQTGTPSVLPSLDLHLVPAITLTGSIGGSVRVDAINQFGPIDAWFTLDTVTLTNTSQLYFDTSAWGQPQRLYRSVQFP